MLLSGLGSNKYRAILGFKKHIADYPENALKDCLDNDREVDEFGELSAKKITISQKRLSPAETEALIAEYQSGKEPTELGEKFGIHRITVGKILRRNGIPIRNTCQRKK